MTIAARYSRNASIALGVALVWSLLLVGAAFVAPVYSSSTGSSSSDVTSGATTTASQTTGTGTLVGVNGPGVLVFIALPLLATLVVAWALARGRRRSGWVVTSVLGVLTVLALLSVGIFFLPVTLALVVACANTPRPRVARPADPASLSA
jgi:hypothetical protein